MHGLKEDGKIAYYELKKHLKPFGYAPTKQAPGMWKHSTNSIIFTLIVDDFGIKHTTMKDVTRLIQALRHKHSITTNLKVELYSGVYIQWYYVRRTVILSIPGYVKKVLLKHHHPEPARARHAPRQPEPITCGPHQPSTALDTNDPLLPTDVLLFQ